MFINTNRPQRLIFVLILITGLFVGCSSPNADTGPTPVLSSHPQTSLPLPPVTAGGSNSELGWVLTDGSRVKLSEHKGKVLVLDLYATWCEPCRESIPHLIELHRRYEKKGLDLVGLNVGGPDDRVKVASFAAEFHITYPLGFPDQPLTDLLLSDTTSIPQTYVFNREGKLLKRFIGYDDSMPAQLDQLIQSELASGSR